MAFWIDTFINEKGLDREHVFEKTSPNGTVNLISLGRLIEAIRGTELLGLHTIRDTLVRIDFKNGDVMHYFDHLAGTLAIDFDQIGGVQ